MQRKLQIFGWTLIWSGAFLLGYAGYELLVTDLINARIQNAAASQVVDTLQVARQELPPVEVVPTGEGQDDPQNVEFHPEEPPEVGEEFAILRVPRLGLEVVVFEGVDVETLKKGPGHMPGTALPGQPGNAVLSGHRTTYGRPFFDFDQLRPGDRIEVETAIGTHVYELQEEWFIVEPTDVWVTDDRLGGWLTLTTCHPKFSARQRLIVTAKLIDGPNLAYTETLEERGGDLS
ncbi:MAG: class E sortase [Actinobacteria bacterium]|nr:MAG: class E sortase [Actinomycetota bacterium]REK40564.1 MAG: class E sortase [Actinomycetota bacterium]